MVKNTVEVNVAIVHKNDNNNILDEEIKKLSKLQQFTQAFGSAQTQAFGAAALGAMAFAKGLEVVGQGFTALKDYVSNSVQEFAAFNYQMQLLEGLIDDESASVASLGATISAMSVNSVYGVMDLAEAYKTLASMGSYNARETEILISSWQQLALVSGTELNQAVTIATQAMRVFGYEVDEAGEVADILYNATKEGALNMYDIGTALQYVGSNASMMNMTLAETTGLLALLSNRGFTASTAGTSLSMMFDTLINPSDEAQRALDRLNISIYDTNGSMRNMYDVLDDLNAATTNMTEKERNFYLSTIFGQRGLRATVALLEWMNSAEGAAAGGLRGFSDELEEGGKVLNKYDAVMETAHARILQMQNAWQQLSITAGGVIWDKGIKSFDAMNQSLGPLVITGDGFTKVFEVIGTILGELGYLFGMLANTINLVLQVLDPLVTVIGVGLTGVLWGLGGVLKFVNDNLTFFMPLLQLAISLVITYTIVLGALTAAGYIHTGYLALQRMLYLLTTSELLTLTATTIAHTAAIAAHTIWQGIATAAQWLWNAALWACPVLLVAAGIVVLTGAIIVIVDWLMKLFKITGLVNDLWQGFLQTITNVLEGIRTFLGPLADLVMSFFPHSEICLSYGLELSTKNMKQFNQQLQQMDRTVAMSTPAVAAYGSGVMTAAESYGGSEGSTNNNTVNITIQGDVKDEETLRRIERDITRNRAMFTG